MNLKPLLLTGLLGGLMVPAQAAILTDFTAGTLTLTAQNEAQIVLDCNAGAVIVNGSLPLSPSGTKAVNAGGGLACASVQTVIVNGDSLDNEIDLSAMTAVDYPALTGTTLFGASGNDTIDGSFSADLITGGPGSDEVVAGAGNDTITWNPGDGTDSNDGGDDLDRIVVQGGGGADPFFVGPNDPAGTFFNTLAQPGFSVLFVRDPGFSIAIRDAEVLEINGNGGTDTIDGSALAAGLIALELNGGDDNDTIFGSADADLISGGAGADNLVGGRGTDAIAGDAGDDTITWNPGDGTDSNDGGDDLDRIVVQGGGGADPFFVGPNDPAGTFFNTLAQPGFSVLFVRDPGFSIAIRDAEVLEINGNGGTDTIDGSALAAGLIALELNGGDDNDTLTGSPGIDLISGGPGNDTVDANQGNDSIDLGPGDDNNTWNNGDGSDGVLGGDGADRHTVNGAGVGDNFTVTDGTAPVEVRFARSNLGPFTIDLTEVEVLEVNGLGGDDSISAPELTAGLIALELNGGDGADTIIGSQGADLISGGPGNDQLDGHDNPPGTVDQVLGGDGDDVMIWNPGKDDDVNIGGDGNDTTLIVGGGAAEQFFIREEPVGSGIVRFSRTTANAAPAAFFVDISQTELLRLNANGGDDSADASTLPVGLINLELNGGGNDTLIGSFGADVLNGDDGDDSLRAGQNPVDNEDRMDGGAGNDQIVWNPGDGNDINEGGAGTDTLLVNGAGANEQFEIAAAGPRVRLARLQPTIFVLDSGSIEVLELNASGGDDLVNTQPLPGVLQLLDGGAASSAAGDHLNVSGTQASAATSPILTPGFGAIDHVNFESAESRIAGGSFSALLDGDQEVPPVNTTALGRGTVVLNADESKITVRLSFSDLSSPSTLAHIHGPAAAGSNAAPIFALTGLGGTSADLGPFEFDVTPQQAADVKAGLWYFNVHSQAQPGGEIRGQIVLDRVFAGPLEGRQVVPRAETQANGYVTATLAGAMDQVFITLVYSGLTGEGVPGASVDVAIFGPARRGAAGSRIVELSLPVSGEASDQVVAGPFAITPEQAQDLAAELWYAQVASEEFPQGEIRGQMTQSLYFDDFE